jgi:hypothetical protein
MIILIGALLEAPLQNLIQQLPSGLYKIEKNYEDGAKQETIILKENE